MHLTNIKVAQQI